MATDAFIKLHRAGSGHRPIRVNTHRMIAYEEHAHGTELHLNYQGFNLVVRETPPEIDELVTLAKRKER